MRNLIPSINNSPLSIGALYRLLLLDVIPQDIKKILYFDSDTVINLDVNKLFEIELNDKPLAAVSETKATGISPKAGGYLPLCAEGIISGDDYFNAGVLIMNLEQIRKEQNNLREGIFFIANNPKYNVSMDQDILNYCFANRTMKLSTDYNVQVCHSRWRGDFKTDNRICHYISCYKGIGVTMDLSDNFNKLWFKYFTKTPWFNAEAVKHTFETARQIYIDQKNFALYVSAMMSGKTRAFYVSPQNFVGVKNIFGVQKSEEIIFADSDESIKKLIKSLRKSKHKKVFFMMLESPEILKIVGNELLKAGFKENQDFINAVNFLSDIHGVPFNSFTLINAM